MSDTVDLLAPEPTPPQRVFSFTNWSVNNPTSQQPGDRLDSEFDRTNQSVASTISWVQTSLATDGTLQAASVGQPQLVPGLFDWIAQDAIDQVQPLVDEASSYASAAAVSASTAGTSVTASQSAATSAQSAANHAIASATTAQTSSDSALVSSENAQASQAAAQDAANHALGDAALSSDLAVVSQAWAEHMPDTIPPNILAVMNITGDHWSSRWWATKAANAFGQLTELYLGALPYPPTSTATNEPLQVGAIYYNTTYQAPYIWNGTEWVQFWAPTKALTLTLVYVATAGQTVFVTTTPDLAGNVWTFNDQDPEPVEAHANGVRLVQTVPTYSTGDWSLNATANTVTFAQPLLAGTVVVFDILAPASRLAPAQVTTQLLLDFDVDPSTGNPGLIDGARTTFHLALATDRSPVTVSSAVELLVFVDGITQKPGTDYNVSGTNITFGEALTVGGTAWSIWYANPGAAATTTAMPTIAPFAAPVATPVSTPAPETCACPVGTVMTSLLPPDVFAREMPDTQDWRPAGADIVGTRLAELTGRTRVPVWTHMSLTRTHHYVRVN